MDDRGRQNDRTRQATCSFSVDPLQAGMGVSGESNVTGARWRASTQPRWPGSEGLDLRIPKPLAPTASNARPLNLGPALALSLKDAQIIRLERLAVGLD